MHGNKNSQYASFHFLLLRNWTKAQLWTVFEWTKLSFMTYAYISTSHSSFVFFALVTFLPFTFYGRYLWFFFVKDKRINLSSMTTAFGFPMLTRFDNESMKKKYPTILTARFFVKCQLNSYLSLKKKLFTPLLESKPPKN